MPETKPHISFEDKIEVIDREIGKRRIKWRLDALNYIDYDDVSQILRIHIFKQWHLWDQNRPLEPWLNVIITNQTINLVRNHYGRVAPPCNGCPHNISNDFCSFTKSGTKCAECPLYKKWQQKNQVGYNIKLATSIDTEEFVEPKSSATQFNDNIDYDTSLTRLHSEMKKALSPANYKVYDLLVIQGLPERTVAKRLNLKSTEKGRAPGYKSLGDFRNKFYEMARDIIKEKDIL